MDRASPLDVILNIAGGHCLPRALHVIADFGVADALDGPMRVDALAAASGTNADALSRLLRLLSAHGLFELNGDVVSHNEASQLLRSDHPRSARGLARMFGLPPCWNSFERLDHSLRTGRPAAEQLYPDGLWSYFADHPEAGAIFDQAMTGKAAAQVAGLVEAYDFSAFATIADIGGGRGHLLQAILGARPGTNGILFDLPHVARAVAESDRLSVHGGDFFKDPLPTCDAYVLMEVIHDWDDEDSLAILSAVARAAPAGATLLIAEQLVPDAPGPAWPKMLDIHMLALLGGRQRTGEEYHRLLQAAGFEPQRTIETFSGIALIEATKP
jgi:hypothetical protein